MNIYQENEDDCATIIDTLFPYLLVACFLFGISIMRISKNLTLRNSNTETGKNSDFVFPNFGKTQKEKEQKF